MNITKAFNMAKEMSLSSDYEKKNIRIGCVLFDRHNNPIGFGYNSKKTHPMQKKYNELREKHYATMGDRKYVSSEHSPTLHAEIMALVDIKNKRERAESAVIYRDGMCKPCPACMMALRQNGVKKIFYTNERGEYEYEEI